MQNYWRKYNRMKKFNWEDFKNTRNIAVHCKTEKEAKDFCKQMHKHGMTWSSRRSYLVYTYYEEYKEQSCYTNYGFVVTCNFCKENGYKILEWSDYMQKEFTKDDLKDGMVVEQRDRTRFLVIGDRLVYKEGYNRLEGYGDDLKDIQYKEGNIFDIVKVFRIKNRSIKSLADIFEDNCLDLIWERKKTMTVEEMRQKLEKLTGERIDVISD